MERNSGHRIWITHREWDLGSGGTARETQSNGMQIVFCIKYEHGSINKFKSHLIVKGFSQMYGIHYEETCLPVVQFLSIRVPLAWAACSKWRLIKWTSLWRFWMVNMRKGSRCSSQMAMSSWVRSIWSVNWRNCFTCWSRHHTAETTWRILVSDRMKQTHAFLCVVNKTDSV